MAYYVINISNKKGHVFATNPNSIVCQETLEKVYKEITKRFPRKEGFVADVTRYEKIGTPVKGLKAGDK